MVQRTKSIWFQSIDFSKLFLCSIFSEIYDLYKHIFVTMNYSFVSVELSCINEIIDAIYRSVSEEVRK